MEYQAKPNSMESLREYAEEFRKIQKEIEDLEEQVSKKKIIFDVIRTKRIPEMMEALGLKTATFEGLPGGTGRVQLASDLYASTKEGQKEKAMQWLRDCGYENMITEGYNASSLKALFRGMLKEGAEIPEEIFSVSPFTRASVVKA